APRRGGAQAGVAPGPRRPHPAAALRGPAAAGGHRPRHRGRSADHRRRRADWRPRPQERRGRAGPLDHAQRDAGQDHRDGHPRSALGGAGEDPAPAGQGAAHMTLTGLALRNAFVRNKTRSFLTILGTVVAAFAFVFLRSVLTAFYASSEASAADRVVTRNAISL